MNHIYDERQNRFRSLHERLIFTPAAGREAVAREALEDWPLVDAEAFAWYCAGRIDEISRQREVAKLGRLWRRSDTPLDRVRAFFLGLPRPTRSFWAALVILVLGLAAASGPPALLSVDHDPALARETP